MSLTAHQCYSSLGHGNTRTHLSEGIISTTFRCTEAVDYWRVLRPRNTTQPGQQHEAYSQIDAEFLWTFRMCTAKCPLKFCISLRLPSPDTYSRNCAAEWAASLTTNEANSTTFPVSECRSESSRQTRPMNLDAEARRWTIKKKKLTNILHTEAKVRCARAKPVLQRFQLANI